MQSQNNDNQINEQKKQKENKQQSTNNLKQEIKKQLQSMEFQKQYIQEALTKTYTLEQAIEYIITRLQSIEQLKMNESQKLTNQSNQVKVFFIVRMDLKMGPGKIAAQVAHAALKSFQNMRNSTYESDQKTNLLIQWMQKGQSTITLQGQDQNKLFECLNKANQKKINTCYIRDAGRTQIAAGSLTVVAIGPVRECDVSFLNQLKQL